MSASSLLESTSEDNFFGFRKGTFFFLDFTVPAESDPKELWELIEDSFLLSPMVFIVEALLLSFSFSLTFFGSKSLLSSCELSS